MNNEVESVSMKELRDKLEEILGVYFYEFYTFFQEIISSEYDFVVLLARRCLVLYYIFRKLFDADDASESALSCAGHPRILSDKAIGQLLYLRGQEARILVVDDVVIHGNHLWCVCAQLEKLLPEAKITPKVYMRSDCQKNPTVPKTFWERLQWSNQSRDGQWMELSDRIVSTIYCSNIPYISYLNAYHVERPTTLEEPCDIMFIDSTNMAQRHLECTSKVVFCNQDRPAFLEAVSNLDCVRVYESKYDSQMMVIPYSFTKALHTDRMQAFFSRLAGLLPDNMSHTKAQLAGQTTSMAEDIVKIWSLYQQRLFKALTSQVFGLFFFHGRCQPSDTLSFYLEMSFDSETARELCAITYEDIQLLLRHGADELGDYFCPNLKENEYFALCFSGLRRSGQSSENYEDYIQQHREYEEQRITQNGRYNGKLPGLSVDYILNQEDTLDGKRFAAAKVLSLNDSGCMTSSFNYNEDGSAAASFVSNGEQSFSLVLRRYPYIIRKIIFLAERRQNVSAYLEGLESWLRNRTKDADKMMRELREFYAQNKNRLSNINVTTILEEPDYWVDDDAYELSAFHREYFSIE